MLSTGEDGAVGGAPAGELGDVVGAAVGVGADDGERLTDALDQNGVGDAGSDRDELRGQDLVAGGGGGETAKAAGELDVASLDAGGHAGLVDGGDGGVRALPVGGEAEILRAAIGEGADELNLLGCADGERATWSREWRWRVTVAVVTMTVLWLCMEPMLACTMLVPGDWAVSVAALVDGDGLIVFRVRPYVGLREDVRGGAGRWCVAADGDGAPGDLVG